MPNWLFPWRHQPFKLTSDLIAGLVVAILIIPQAIGYGLLSHLPPSTALASCILPLIAYAVFGRSHALAIGPVAIISLMVGDALQTIPEQDMIACAQLLALQVSLVLLALRLLSLGNLVHFIGHPVIHGFTTAAAILIIVRQIPHLIGAPYSNPSEFNFNTVSLGIALILCMFVIKRIPQSFLSKLGPLFAVTLGCVITYLYPNAFDTIQMDNGPYSIQLSWLFPWQYFNTLMPSAILIGLIGFLESTSVAKNLASQRKEGIHANQELLGLSAANVSAAFFQGYPVAGGFGRTMVNHQAGATSPLSGVFTAIFVTAFLIFATNTIAYIPMVALGAVVAMAVWPLLDFAPAYKEWSIHPRENTIWVTTFIMVLWQGVEVGLFAGVVLSIFFLLRSSAKPHIAIIGRIPGTAHFRNIKRHDVLTHDALLAIRIDEGLHFANRDAIDRFIEQAVDEHPDIQHLLLVFSAVNVLDSDGMELLEHWKDKLAEQDKILHLSEVKGPIMDDLTKRGFSEVLHPGRIFLSTHEAFEALSISPSNPMA